jgi:hypothetical protein
MTPFEWIMAISAIIGVLGTASAAFSEEDITDRKAVENIGAEAPEGGGGIATPPTPNPADALQAELANIVGQPGLTPPGAPTSNFMQGQAAPTPVEAPKTETPAGTGKDVEAPTGAGDIGNILAASAQAMAALDGMFNPDPIVLEGRTAPAAGANAPGGPVGQFGSPFGGGQQANIGQLLAALPGIR